MTAELTNSDKKQQQYLVDVNARLGQLKNLELQTSNDNRWLRLMRRSDTAETGDLQWISYADLYPHYKNPRPGGVWKIVKNDLPAQDYTHRPRLIIDRTGPHFYRSSKIPELYQDSLLFAPWCAGQPRNDRRQRNHLGIYQGNANNSAAKAQ